MTHTHICRNRWFLLIHQLIWSIFVYTNSLRISRIWRSLWIDKCNIWLAKYFQIYPSMDVWYYWRARPFPIEDDSCAPIPCDRVQMSIVISLLYLSFYLSYNLLVSPPKQSIHPFIHSSYLHVILYTIAYHFD